MDACMSMCYGATFVSVRHSFRCDIAPHISPDVEVRLLHLGRDDCHVTRTAAVKSVNTALFGCREVRSRVRSFASSRRKNCDHTTVRLRSLSLHTLVAHDAGPDHLSL